ncbi:MULTISPECIES: hypothetical protein [unclassified Frankia]|uniref:hypothetical protein n=1 Tax=unclassified Frankia TaxID=2632575 RepID=UPI002AD1E1EB|nr:MULTISPECIES: hypothetical protein [unclassified Frankia]
MFESRAADHALSGSTTSKVFDMLSGVLTDVVGLAFVLYLAAAVVCILLALLLRVRGRLGHTSAERFSVTESIGRPAGRRVSR